MLEEEGAFLKWKIGSFLWMIIAMGIFHLKLLYAIINSLHLFFNKGLKTTIYSDGKMRLSFFSFYKATMVFFALSAIWHYFTCSNPMNALQWNFSVRPQVNFKPQMCLMKSHSTPEVISSSCSDRIKTIRSQSDIIQYKMTRKVDLGFNVDKNIILDSILTLYECVISLLSLASEFVTSIKMNLFINIFN